MKIIVQRLSSCTISQQNQSDVNIGTGILVYVGIHKNDCDDDVAWISRKMLNINVWPSEDEKPWKKSVVDMSGYVVLCFDRNVYVNVDSSYPSYDDVMEDDKATLLMEKICEKVKQSYKKDKVLLINEKCKLNFHNQGPITFILDSFNRRD